jgi:hypothetical protein
MFRIVNRCVLTESINLTVFTITVTNLYEQNCLYTKQVTGRMCRRPNSDRSIRCPLKNSLMTELLSVSEGWGGCYMFRFNFLKLNYFFLNFIFQFSIYRFSNFQFLSFPIFNFRVYYTTCFMSYAVSVTITSQFHLISYSLLLCFFSSSCPTFVSKLGTHCS